MGFFIFLFLVYVLSAEYIGRAYGFSHLEKEEYDEVPKCPKTRKLVCGENGKIYANSCFMEKDDVRKSADWEECRGKHWLCPAHCSKEYSPVCGPDDVVYSNRCHMQYLNCGTFMVPRAKEKCDEKTEDM